MSRSTTRTTSGVPPFAFGTWIRLHGVDVITMALAGALGLGVYFAPPAYSRSFPVFTGPGANSNNGELVDSEIGYPVRAEIVPIWLAAFIAFMAPFVFFCLFQIRRKSVNDLLCTTMGLLKSLITAALFQVFIKWLIGGLRPHFLSVCNPVLPVATAGNGFANTYFDRRICTGDEKSINDALESMPSGHTTAAFAGLVYLSLYFNAQLKLLSSHNPAYWKMILFYAPILGAILIGGAMTMDEWHHWYDVLAGAVIGTTMAFTAFRMTFASVWDFRFNHLLLPRTSSLFLRHPINKGEGLAPSFPYIPGGHQPTSAQLPFTREGGWGEEMGTTGAPFDASSLGNNGIASRFTGTRGHNVEQV